MDLGLSHEQRALRETFAALFRKESTPERVRIAESTGLDQALWQSYAQVEALAIGIPSDYGGADGGLLELALVAEEGRGLPRPRPRPGCLLASAKKSCWAPC